MHTGESTVGKWNRLLNDVEISLKPDSQVLLVSEELKAANPCFSFEQQSFNTTIKVNIFLIQNFNQSESCKLLYYDCMFSRKYNWDKLPNSYLLIEILGSAWAGGFWRDELAEEVLYWKLWDCWNLNPWREGSNMQEGVLNITMVKRPQVD